VSTFGSVRVLSEKNIQTGKKKDPKPNRNRPKPAGSGPVSVRFFIQKTGQTYRLILGFLIGFLMGFVMGF
jgi:hypothetical protein